MGEKYMGEKYVGESLWVKNLWGEMGVDGMLAFVPRFSGIYIELNCPTWKIRIEGMFLLESGVLTCSCWHLSYLADLRWMTRARPPP